MHRHYQHSVPRTEPHQLHPQQRPDAQIKSVRARLAPPTTLALRPCFAFTQIHELLTRIQTAPAHPATAVHQHFSKIVLSDSWRRTTSANARVQAATFEALAFQSQRRVQVVKARARRKLVQEPQTLLRKRRREPRSGRSIRWSQRDSRSLASRINADN
jgi:hypothetical protein